MSCSLFLWIALAAVVVVAFAAMWHQHRIIASYEKAAEIRRLDLIKRTAETLK